MCATSSLKTIVLLHEDDAAAIQLDGWLQEFGTKTVYSAKSMATVEAALVGGSIDLAIVVVGPTCGGAERACGQLDFARVPILVLDTSPVPSHVQTPPKMPKYGSQTVQKKFTVDRFPVDRQSFETAINRVISAS